MTGLRSQQHSLLIMIMDVGRPAGLNGKLVARLKHTPGKIIKEQFEGHGSHDKKGASNNGGDSRGGGVSGVY